MAVLQYKDLQGEKRLLVDMRYSLSSVCVDTLLMNYTGHKDTFLAQRSINNRL